MEDEFDPMLEGDEGEKDPELGSMDDDDLDPDDDFAADDDEE